MPRTPLCGALLCLGLGLACDGLQTVPLTAEDFRFVPSLVRVQARTPLTLVVYNAGREVHEFDSPILLYAERASIQQKAGTAAAMTLRPGQSVQLAVAPPPGTYLYICRRKGHGNMTGTLVVE